MVSFTPPAALPWGKEALVPTGYEAEGALKPVLTLWRREKSLTLPGIEPRILGRAARSLVAILSYELAWKCLLCFYMPLVRAKSRKLTREKWAEVEVRDNSSRTYSGVAG
jgi:hypothetical protein